MRRSVVRARGFTLFEMMAVIILLGVFALVATRLLATAARSLRDVPASTDGANRLDAALRSLRRDVWSAGRVEVPDAATLVAVAPDGSSVRWAITTAGDLERAASASPGTAGEGVPGVTRWPAGPARSPAFAADPAGAALAWDGGGEVLVCPARLRSAEGGSP